MDPLRDRIFGLLTDLCGEQTDVSPDSLRLLSHTLLGVARDHAPSSLFVVAGALPWAAALVEACDGADPEVVAEMLTTRGATRTLDATYVELRLRAVSRSHTGVGGSAGSLPSRMQRTLRELALLDRRLTDLAMRSDREIRNTTLADTGLLAAAACAATAPAPTTSGVRFRDALQLTERPDIVALMLLSDLESSWDGGTLRSRPGFGERTRRFEISASDHLTEEGFAPAVRLALLYGGAGLSTDEVRQRVVMFDEIAGATELESLTLALAANRNLAARYVKGIEPMRSLAPWTTYLCGACSEIAEARELTLREAISYAHFSFHLLNFCDLASSGGALASDVVRAKLMMVEDELKACALDAQERGTGDLVALLDAFEAGRFEGPEHHLALRYARLSGRRTAEVLDEICHPGFPDDVASRAGRVAATIRFEGAEVFESMEPSNGLRLFAYALGSADRGDTVDFRGIDSWASDARRLKLVDAVVETTAWSGTLTDVGVQVRRSPGRVRVGVRTSEEFEALLALCHAEGVPSSVLDVAEERLRALMSMSDGRPQDAGPSVSGATRPSRG